MLTPQHPYYSANDFFKQKFGTKIIKISLDGGFTCPNRDGSLSTEGCIFCSGKGSGDFAGSRAKSITEQFEDMRYIMQKKWHSGKYMAYFQAFTNTYAPIEVLREKYYEAISLPDTVALSIATRPDCINPEVINLLNELSQRVYVCVELGLQTTKPSSVELINRLYSNAVYEKACSELTKNGIDVITHIIVGLPNESLSDMLATLDFAVKCKTSGVKLQLLHIIKGTGLEKLYNDTNFHIPTLLEYAKTIVTLIEHLPSNIVVHRITGDGDKNTLLAPRWSLDKKVVRNTIASEFIKQNTIQGAKVTK